MTEGNDGASTTNNTAADAGETAAMDTTTSSSAAYVPGPNAVDITPDKDGGVLKEILREGEGDDHPCEGEKAYVHYVGRLLDGTVFDSSRERNEKFDFVVGRGSVIKAWDIGVATMKKGELAVLTCKPEYAYGASGSPPKIPPNATLVFEVELFEWKMEDLSPNKDGSITRRIMEKGEGYSTPNDGANVNVHIIGRHNDRVFEDREVSFTLGEGCECNIVKGLEIALQKFKKGEKSKITLKPKYAFGSNGNSELGVPPNESVEYEVHLKSFEKAKESWELDTDEKLEQAEITKNKGTQYFKAGKYQLAIKKYKRVISLLEHESGLEDEKEAKRKSLMVAGHLNLALCYLKQEEYMDALKQCDKAVEIEPDNEKGLFRRGQARLGINEFELAKEDFNAVLKLDPNNKAARNQITVCNQKIKQHLEKERKTYRNMFEKLSKQEPKKSSSPVTQKMDGDSNWQGPQIENWEDNPKKDAGETNGVNAENEKMEVDAQA